MKEAKAEMVEKAVVGKKVARLYWGSSRRVGWLESIELEDGTKIIFDCCFWRVDTEYLCLHGITPEPHRPIPVKVTIEASEGREEIGP